MDIEFRDDVAFPITPSRRDVIDAIHHQLLPTGSVRCRDRTFFRNRNPAVAGARTILLSHFYLNFRSAEFITGFLDGLRIGQSTWCLGSGVLT